MMEGFRQYYERALRTDEDSHDNNWAVHSIDYALFKQRLLFFRQRRGSIKAYLKNSPDGTIPESALASFIGPKVHAPPPRVAAGQHPTTDLGYDEEQQQQQQQYGQSGGAGAGAITGMYIPFVDEGDTSSSTSSIGSQSDTSNLFSFSNPNKHKNRYKNTSPTTDKCYRKKQVMRRISNTERNEVTLFLTYELEKVVKFYTSQCQVLSEQLLQYGPSVSLGMEILELHAHVSVNLMALRQSLIRYDAFARTYGGTPMLVWYIKKMNKHFSVTAFRKLYYHEELTGIWQSYETEYCTSVSIMEEGNNAVTSANMMIPLQDLRSQWELMEHLDKESSQKAELSNASSGGQLVLRDNAIHVLRQYMLAGAIEDQMLSLQPTFLDQRGASLSPEMKQLCDWRERRRRQNKIQNQPRSATPDTTGSAHSATRLDGTAKSASAIDPTSITKASNPAHTSMTMYQYFCLALNILSVFFYCMNYYIVEPSSTLYVNALGAPDYVSGMLIGMMPIAAMISAVGFAIWTNYGFRTPLIASALLLMTGNIVYASALKYHSVWIALIGRFMTGLGAPKCIIRRFMADTTPMALRTSVNAGFALAIAVGSALGPAMAIVLNQFDFVGSFPGYGMFEFNGMTGPGYFMSSVWFLYTLTVIFTFGEPDRLGLEEQKRMEEMAEDNECIPTTTSHIDRDDDINTIYTSQTRTDQTVRTVYPSAEATYWTRFRAFLDLITPPVRLCLALLFAKTFTIESLVSCTSALTKNRYGWKITQVGILGCINGMLVVPLSITVGYLSRYYQDRLLMTWLVTVGCVGMFLLIDVTDIVETPTDTYNEGVPLAVTPTRYVSGYFLTYISIQAFEGVIGSSLSKVIPTALASGTFNSGLLATLVDTLGRACGDFFIALMGFVEIRQLMNLLFIPAFTILVTCLFTIRKQYDLLAV